ncbi:MAG: hypothetical protein EAZ99_12150 [Alphaproteobacteria bacterium]|nr:hypothetical protein [Alphaproteobacteria bacterium]TAD88894.1 MAG: hypothetical protein EAZ99_12150 [Alphaproteobacteria bacterium]
MSTGRVGDRGFAGGDVRVGPSARQPDRERASPLDVVPSGFRARIPSPQQILSLLKDGVLQLPARYFRGYFLDVLV